MKKKEAVLSFHVLVSQETTTDSRRLHLTAQQNSRIQIHADRRPSTAVPTAQATLLPATASCGPGRRRRRRQAERTGTLRNGSRDTGRQASGHRSGTLQNGRSGQLGVPRQQTYLKPHGLVNRAVAP